MLAYGNDKYLANQQKNTDAKQEITDEVPLLLHL